MHATTHTHIHAYIHLLNKTQTHINTHTHNNSQRETILTKRNWRMRGRKARQELCVLQGSPEMMRATGGPHGARRRGLRLLSSACGCGNGVLTAWQCAPWRRSRRWLPWRGALDCCGCWFMVCALMEAEEGTQQWRDQVKCYRPGCAWRYGWCYGVQTVSLAKRGAHGARDKEERK